MKIKILCFGVCMKKIVRFCLISLTLCFAFVSCASTKKAVSEEVVEQPEVAAPVEEVVNEKENNSFIGWIGVKGKDVDFSAGKVKLYGKTKLGTFNIYVVNSQNNEIPVFSVSNEFSSSGFFLKQGNKIYNLNKDANIEIFALKTDFGIKIAYSIPKVAEVVVNFECLKSLPMNDFDMVKISASVKNTSKNTNNFALKCVLDTVFGENKKYHFYTSNDVGIKNETLYRTMKNEKWFVSKNDNNAVQILLDGADITSPEVVVLANKLTFESNSWEPTVSSKKTFDNVLSYNDSAVCVIWPEKNLNQEASFTESFYLAVASDGAKTYGYDYILAKEKNLPMESTPVIVEPKKEVYAESEPVKEDRFIPNVKFDVTTLSKEKFTQEYIQSLIDRISELEDDGANTNRTELLMLNAELDAILEVLRQ